MTAISNRLNTLLFREVSAVPLVAFRIIFGLLMLFGTIRFMAYGWVYDLYISPSFFFTYYGFEWVHPLPGNWMYLPFAIMVFSSLAIIIGYRYRLASIALFASFTYVELLDKTNYLNHYYLVSLIAFLLCWLPANACFSVDARRIPGIYRETIPAWTIRILQLQLGIVYCCAGIAKIHPDWLFEAQPLRTWLQAYRDLPIVGGLFASVWVAYVFSWFGCIYDLTIPFFLSSWKTRKIAYIFVVVFHVLTWLLFPIGMFPWVMICCTLIFFPAGFHERWISKLRALLHWKSPEPIAKHPRRKQVVYGLLGIYLLFQILVPFRYVVYPGNLFWTEEGFRFSWRVMLMQKEGYATFYVVDRQAGGSIEIDNTCHLTPIQIDQMSTQPDMILQYAHYLGRQFEDTMLVFDRHSVHLRRPKVEADVYVSLNGRMHQQFVSRKTDLLREHYSLKHRTWVNDFSSDRR